MSHTPQTLFAFLDRLGIAHKTIEHPAIFTVEQGRLWRDKIPGVHCKNLFLKDGKGVLWLVVMPADKRADLSRIAQKTGAARLSFANSNLLHEVLGVTPGSVTPFALINDMQKRVKVVLDEDMLRCDKVTYHPLRNTASTTVRAADLVIFVRALDYDPIVVDCGAEKARNNG